MDLSVRPLIKHAGIFSHAQVKAFAVAASIYINLLMKVFLFQAVW